MSNTPNTLQEAIRYFSDEDLCVKTVAAARWPEGPVCPHCGVLNPEHYYLASQRRWKCKDCRKQFSVKQGSIFEDSPIPLNKWLCALWLVANCKNGISSYEVGRDLGVTQKSAWFMLHRLRLAMQVKSLNKLGGPGKEIEVDESFIGGAARFMHKERRERMITHRGVNEKAAAFGILERGGKVRVFHVQNRKRKTLLAPINEHVEPGTAIYSDNFMSYIGLNEKFVHDFIDHAERYVKGRVHTNGLENFWSLLKRGIKGTYVAVEPFHLFRYLDEQAWRYNNRATKTDKVNDGDRFALLLSHVAGKRLTFAEVTGKVGQTSAN